MARRSTALTFVFLMCWAVLMGASRTAPTPAREPLSAFPFELDGWHGSAGAPLDRRSLEILGADDYVTRIYRDNVGGTLSLYVGYHATQKHGDSIHSPMSCLPGAGWIPIRADRVQLGEAQSPTVNRVVIQKADERQLVLYWYQGRGRIIADEYVSKGYLFLDALRSGRTDAALVRVITPMDPVRGEADAERRAASFAVKILPLLPRHLPN
jgi:EpsI family protein